MRTSSIVVRVTAWYGWVFLVLGLAFGTYIYKCLDYGLSLGVQNALSIRAQEIGRLFAATGQLPVRQRSSGPASNDPFISVHPSAGPASGSSGKPGSRMVSSENFRREPSSVSMSTTLVRRPVHGARFLIATAHSTFGNNDYIVEIGTPKQPIRAVFRESAITMLIGLVMGLAFATLGSLFLVQRALVPVGKIALAMQALPVVRPDEPTKEVAALEQIEGVCVTVNEMVGELEDSFQIGAGLSPSAFRSPGNRLRTVRGELAHLFKIERRPIGVDQMLLQLLKECERLSELSRNLAVRSSENPRQTRTARLRFYLGGLAASAAEHVCTLTKQLGVDLASEARDTANEDFSVHW